MKILYLSFYFEPDLCAGSFRNTPLVNELAGQLAPGDRVDVITTQPNRYRSFKRTAPAYEERENGSGCRVRIHRVAVPAHTSGLLDQVRSFWAYYRAAHRLTRQPTYDLVVASSSRLFTAFLGAQVARNKSIPLFLDIRDLFRETILEMIRPAVFRLVLNPVLTRVETYTFGYATHINLVSKGFQAYFNTFRQATYSYFTNGIDPEFLAWEPLPEVTNRAVKTILYAGNIGEGQGLHKLIPSAARQLGNDYRFLVIGDGGARAKLALAIRDEAIQNVKLREPVRRADLVAEYRKADYLMLHLNDLKALERVLPSKLFEYGATDKPIIAGVAGYAAEFIRENIDNCMLFAPGDVASLVAQLQQTPYRTAPRTAFVARFQRQTIVRTMARLIRETLPPMPA